MPDRAFYETPWEQAAAVNGQAAVVARELVQWSEGHSHVAFDALSKLLESGGVLSGKILEVGCGLGYNSLVIQKYSKDLEYTGIDVSPLMIESARKHCFAHPESLICTPSFDWPFMQGDFDVVLLGACLGSTVDPLGMIASALRVAKRPSRIIAHKVLMMSPETEADMAEIDREAYGQQIREWAFTERFLQQHFGKPVDYVDWSHAPAERRWIRSAVFNYAG